MLVHYVNTPRPVGKHTSESLCFVTGCPEWANVSRSVIGWSELDGMSLVRHCADTWRGSEWESYYFTC